MSLAQLNASSEEVRTAVLIAKYQSLTQYVAYLDSYVQKVFAVFAIFAGAVIANADQLAAHRLPMTVGTLLAAAMAYLMLWRISLLVSAQVGSVRLTEQALAADCPESGVIQTFPTEYGRGLSTSRIARVGIVLLAIVACIAPYVSGGGGTSPTTSSITHTATPTPATSSPATKPARTIENRSTETPPNP